MDGTEEKNSSITSATPSVSVYMTDMMIWDVQRWNRKKTKENLISFTNKLSHSGYIVKQRASQCRQTCCN
jgi:hypothetical protein